ncbi:hypothetical protein SLW73_05685 [Glutamicibacter protophormiae]|uniref:hypothetical protein n=1 Tax=Glutamicibacter protophormiae TaxID=37930 RepID=UPI002A7FE626|nr:hypothetical protein [Glutamicibacter protophormiae]WPR65813.1 hypothetical protein SLW72_05685 [Glutamicibacter protophormiae]WPR69312.1 hypothetical protein SLW73_05685 [Glutamicibacter protophormiae]
MAHDASTGTGPEYHGQTALLVSGRSRSVVRGGGGRRILGPAAYWTGSQGDVDTAYLLKFLATILPIAMLSGIGVGILSWAATYAAVGILEVRRPEATALHQAAAGAAGSMAGGLLPALVIFPSVLAEEPNFGIIYGLVFGLMALCFILAFGTLLALNRPDVRQRPGT